MGFSEAMIYEKKWSKKSCDTVSLIINKITYQCALVPFLSNITALSLLSRVALPAVFSVPAATTLLTLYTGHKERRGSMCTYQQSEVGVLNRNKAGSARLVS